VFSNSQLKLAHSPTEYCFQNITTTELGNEIKSNSTNSRGMLYLESENNNKYYLRINPSNNNYILELVCEGYVKNVSHHALELFA